MTMVNSGLKGLSVILNLLLNATVTHHFPGGKTYGIVNQNLWHCIVYDTLLSETHAFRRILHQF